MTKFLSTSIGKWLIVLLFAFVSGFLCVGANLIYDIYMVFAPTTTTFTSPSGTQTFSISESCFSTACDQTATLKISSDSAPAKQLTCDLHSSWDGIHFEDAVVEWSEDEQIIYWKFRSSSEDFTEIDIAADCQ